MRIHSFSELRRQSWLRLNVNCWLKKESSQLWRKRLKVVRRVHERISNKRCNFVHQESRKLVSRFGFMAFEDLNVEGMMRNGNLAKSIADAGWSMFVNATRCKAEEAGSKVVLESSYR